ncbi:uncharacterized protein [Elaeis guineensis]|uniref:uncharacterized protein n=1 Tax=Elaeis guineensis var. tenera TaxID=51953 RepID=UPI003C6D15FB
MVGMIQEATGILMSNDNMEFNHLMENEGHEGSNQEIKDFFRLLEDAERPLYPNCMKFTSLSFIVRLLHLKVLSGWTDKSFTLLLELLNDAFPEGVCLPNSYYQANKITTDLGFTYETWDACPNNCMLFRGKDEGHDKCQICQSSRYKQFTEDSNDDTTKNNQIAAKQVRYFPLKPRLQKFFMSSKTAELMRWHEKERTKDGVQRHPADSIAWRTFDERNPSFAADCRNIRLGLAADGFNPFRSMSIAHSTWPVVLIPYNLPPWMSMKQPFFILSVLIDGPKGSGNKIDVYLQPLIEELNELWERGVLTYDASKKEMFQLHAALLWTISDFPAYANLSGWSTKEMGIRKALHPQQRVSGKAYLPPACFTMSKDDKDIFLKVLKNVRVPDGYASNISRCVHLKERSIWGLKSHDNHILMQQLLPVAVRKALAKDVVEALIELTNFFRQLCSKVNKMADLEYIQGRIALTLCQLEKIFPPSFFDIMEHLPIHLAEEALIAGAVQFRWMYPIERKHIEYLRRQMPRSSDDQIEKIHVSTFHTWLMEHVRTSEIQYSDEIQHFARGPDQFVRRYGGYIINGFRFRKLDKDNKRTTQSHGIVVKAHTNPVESGWSVVLKMTVRDLFDMYSKDGSNNIKSVPQAEPFNEQHLDETIYTRDDDVHWVREGVDGTTVDDMRSIEDDVEMDEDE